MRCFVQERTGASFAATAGLIYKLHKTNYIAADLVTGDAQYVDNYTTQQLEDFMSYAEHSSLKGPSLAAREKIMDFFLAIYANPVFNKFL